MATRKGVHRLAHKCLTKLSMKACDKYSKYKLRQIKFYEIESR